MFKLFSIIFYFDNIQIHINALEHYLRSGQRCAGASKVNGLARVTLTTLRHPRNRAMNCAFISSHFGMVESSSHLSID